MKLLYLLLVFVPIGLASKYFGGPALLTFTAAALGVVPLAEIIGERRPRTWPPAPALAWVASSSWPWPSSSCQRNFA